MTPPRPDAWDGAERVLDESACPVCARETCDGCAADRPEPETDDARPRHRFRRFGDVMADPPAVAIVDGVLWADRITVLVAESGAGKTFVALDLAAAVADGVPWFGRAVARGSFAFIPFEGDDVGRRGRALAAEKHRTFDYVHVLRGEEPISPLVDRDRIEVPSRGELLLRASLEALRDDLAAAGEPPIVGVGIDTVRASLTGSEDSSEHVSAYLRACRRLLSVVPGAALLLTHHSGWQDGDLKRKRERGSSAFRGNVDATIYVESESSDTGARLTVHTLKAREADTGPPLRLVRRVVTLPEVDRYGRPVTSCVIDWDPRSREDVERERRAADDTRQRTDDLKVLRVLLEHPDATAQRTIRTYAGLSDAAVRDALRRILEAGWATPPVRQRHDYQLTPAGLATLREDQ